MIFVVEKNYIIGTHLIVALKNASYSIHEEVLGSDQISNILEDQNLGCLIVNYSLLSEYYARKEWNILPHNDKIITLLTVGQTNKFHTVSKPFIISEIFQSVEEKFANLSNNSSSSL